jgi:hypothetical protein
MSGRQGQMTNDVQVMGNALHVRDQGKSGSRSSVTGIYMEEYNSMAAYSP